MNEEYNENLLERLQLAVDRMSEIPEEKCKIMSWELKSYFDKMSDFMMYLYDLKQILDSDNYAKLSMDERKAINDNLYADILGDAYLTSFSNPDFAVQQLGNKYGKLLCFLTTEIRACIVYVYENKLLEYVSVAELFLEIYSMFSEEEPKAKYIKDAIYYHMYDYADITVARRVYETLNPEYDFATKIIMNSDLNDISYLYDYGEYIGVNEIKTALFLNSLSEEKVRDMAFTYVNGFIKGFETMRIDIKPKKTVNIRYSIGQERMVKYAIELFEQNGLKPVIYRYPVSRINRKLTLRTGYVGTPANKQYEYDHRMDETLFMDKAFIERKLEVMQDAYEKNKDLASVYAGPAVIEVFGEKPFVPIIKENALRLNEKQQELTLLYSQKSAEIVNKYIPRDKYSFTIIAYPIPEIGDNFEEIFDRIVEVNTLDNEIYKEIQQKIILELDKAEYVHVVGKGDNHTDMKVMLHDIDITKETNFENCLADVNIPLGEVFTSPVLTNTEGVLNVSQVYLNELKYNNLTLTFKDGKIVDYTCDNFDSEEENKAFIKENLMFNHETLPIGEFAIGTNTTAYVMAHEFDIIYKLPILIVEKMGPHFAVGDTCYSYSEEAVLYNPDGREIVAKENECSVLRNSNEEAKKKLAYYNCHTDITIPYEEIEKISAVLPDKTEIVIIEDGRFVLKGTEKLNEPFDKN